jgi:hypothetical protein
VQLWEKLEPVRQEAYQSDYKVIIDSYIQGSGKTLAYVVNNLNCNSNNITFLNDHKLIYEIYKAIYTSGMNGQINGFPLLNILFGKTYFLSDEEQALFNFPKCLCNLYEEEEVFKLLRLGYLPSDYCMNYCPYKGHCLHKDLIHENFNVSNLSSHNNMWLLVKAYIYTDMVSSIFNKFKNVDVIMDENFFNVLYQQIDITPTRIKVYKDTISRAIDTNNELEELWFDFIPILDLIRNNILHGKSIKIERKINLICETLFEFVDRYGAKELNFWNELMKQTVLRGRERLSPRIGNILNSFLNIVVDIEKVNDIDEIKERILIDEDEHLFSYIINRKYLVEDIIRDSKKFIITSSVMNDKIFNTLFPDFIDDYLYLASDTIKPEFRKVYRYTRGVYPKYVLYNAEIKQYTSSFFKLIDIVTKILEKHVNDKIMIVAFKQFIPIIKKNLGIYIKQHNMDVVYAYWYNIEGKNSYKDRDVQIQFGCPGKPDRYLRAISKALSLEKSLISYISIESEQFQVAERLRSVMFKGMKIIYQLSKLVNNNYPSYHPFNKIIELEHRALLSFISKNKYCSTADVCLRFFKDEISERQTANILSTIFSEGLIKKEKKQIAGRKGRPKWVWTM